MRSLKFVVGAMALGTASGFAADAPTIGNIMERIQATPGFSLLKASPEGALDCDPDAIEPTRQFCKVNLKLPSGFGIGVMVRSAVRSTDVAEVSIMMANPSMLDASQLRQDTMGMSFLSVAGGIMGALNPELSPDARTTLIQQVAKRAQSSTTTRRGRWKYWMAGGMFAMFGVRRDDQPDP